MLLQGLLARLIGLEGLAFNDGTPFADEVTLNWIQQQGDIRTMLQPGQRRLSAIAVDQSQRLRL
jgi:hypothetical protein